MELIRDILLTVEGESGTELLAKYEEQEILYHDNLLIEAGLVEGAVTRDVQKVLRHANLWGLTWAGHDFVDAARDKKAWDKVTRAIKDKGGAWTFDILKSMLSRLISDVLVRGLSS